MKTRPESFTITPIQEAQLPQLATFIAAINARPEHHCLHCGRTEAELTAELADLDVPATESFFLAHLAGQWLGVLGADFLPEAGRGWLWGPFITDEAAGGHDTIAAALLRAVLDSAPAGLQQLDAFNDVHNDRAWHFFLGQGFTARDLYHVYAARRENRPDSHPPPAFAPLRPEQLPALDALHDALFPNNYETAETMLNSMSGTKVVFTAGEGTQVDGYILAEVQPVNEGFIHLLGVDSNSRGRGLGQALLHHALNWLFNKHHVDQVSLVVRDNNDARRLYERAGFGLLHSGRACMWLAEGSDNG